MMSGTDLVRRLERLGEDAPACDVDEYRAIADDIRHDETFQSRLDRAKALADENRLVALHLLARRGEVCACEIQAALDLTHATVSHHMARLVDAGLVDAKRRGKWRYYRLTDRGRRMLE